MQRFIPVANDVACAATQPPSAALVETPTAIQIKIDGDVDDKDQRRQYELNLAAQAGRIDDVEEVVLDEAFRVARLAGSDAKVVLKIGERADAASQLYNECPRRRWKMNKRHPAPARGECTTKNGKQDKCHVEQEDAVSGETKMHGNAHPRVDAKPIPT